MPTNESRRLGCVHRRRHRDVDSLTRDVLTACRSSICPSDSSLTAAHHRSRRARKPARNSGEDAGADPEGLVGDEGWDVGRVVSLPPEEESEKGLSLITEKKWFFSLEMAWFCEFWALNCFVRALARKKLSNFPHELMIWWSTQWIPVLHCVVLVEIWLIVITNLMQTCAVSCTFSAFAICCCPSVCRLSVCLSVTLVHPTQPVEIFSNISTPFGTLGILWHLPKILRRSSQGTPPSGGGALNARGVAKYSDFGPIGGYISETVQDRR